MRFQNIGIYCPNAVVDNVYRYIKVKQNNLLMIGLSTTCQYVFEWLFFDNLKGPG